MLAPPNTGRMRRLTDLKYGRLLALGMQAQRGLYMQQLRRDKKPGTVWLLPKLLRVLERQACFRDSIKD